MSRQQEWQQRMKDEGRCIGCGATPIVTKNHCQRCADKARTLSRNRCRLKSGKSLDDPVLKRRPKMEDR